MPATLVAHIHIHRSAQHRAAIDEQKKTVINGIYMLETNKKQQKVSGMWPHNQK